jgi:hypothetical protein
MAFWAVVRAVPHHDRLAAECMAMAGFETFTPKIRVKIESRWRTTPLFAGYFFTRNVDQWGVLERTMGHSCSPRHRNGLRSFSLQKGNGGPGRAEDLRGPER